MTEKLNLSRTLPIGGIVAFSLCSTWALYHLFTGNAQHPTPIYWAPAVTVELVTAWLVYQVVALVRRVTDTKASKRDRRFYAIVLCALLVLTIPTLGASIWANTVEFGGIVLGLLFPTAAVACAFALAIPEAVGTYQKQREDEKEADRNQSEARRLEKEAKRMQVEMDRRRQEQEAEAQRRQVEMDRIQQEKAAEAERKQAEARRKFLESLGNAGRTLTLYQEHPNAKQQDIAELAGVTPRTIREHLNRLEQAGLIERNNGQGVRVL